MCPEKGACNRGGDFFGGCSFQWCLGRTELGADLFILCAQEKRDAKQDEREQNYQKIIEN